MSIMMERVICLAIGYAFGLFQTGYLYGKMHGIDIRDHGSGNAGTTNALRTLGLKAGAVTLIGDAFKCVFAVLAINLIFGELYPEYIRLLSVYAAAGSILGHNYPFYLNFRGGKGIAATAGMILSFGPIVTAMAILVFGSVFFITHYVSLGSILLYLFLFATVILLGQNGYWGMDQIYLNEMYVIVLLLAVLAIWKHRSNIVRLINGNENKTYLKKKNK